MQPTTQKNYITEQENFWAGSFGDDYIARNQGAEQVAAKTFIFSEILRRTDGVKSVIEFGANIGLNLLAISNLLPMAELNAIEINQKAVGALEALEDVRIFHTSILDFDDKRRFDFSFTSGVLIHINPDYLPQVYEKLYQASNRYVLLCEYYNPSPVEIAYHGHEAKLFKRDFAGEMLERFKDLQLVDYGFFYSRVKPEFDDLTWFLMEKKPLAL